MTDIAPSEDAIPRPVVALDTSADLPYELQAKLFEQLATLGVAGAGLVITLKGSILADAPPIIWMGAVEFGLGALVALVAQISLIDGLFARSWQRRRGQIMTMICVILIGMGIGTLGTSVFMGGEREPTQKAVVAR